MTDYSNMNILELKGALLKEMEAHQVTLDKYKALLERQLELIEKLHSIKELFDKMNEDRVELIKL